MKFLLYWTLGFSDIRIPAECVKELLNFSNRVRVPLLRLQFLEDMAVVRVYTRDETALLAWLNGSCIRAEILRRCGIPAVWKRYRHRAGLLLGMSLFFFALYIAPLFIWEINITGLDRLSLEYVTGLLQNEGVYVGAFSPAIDRRAVYTNILQSAEDISWLSVNLQGSSANVEIVERAYVPVTEPLADGANIVAKKDGVVMDIQVVNGRSTVQKGEVVQKGSIIVSGIYDTAKMGTRYVHADAAVYAVVCDEYVTEIPMHNTRRVYGEETVLEMSLKMFGKSINIFKNYFILEENYDTIKREDDLPVFRFDKLPISLETVCALPFEDAEVLLTEQEALSLAKRELFRKIHEEADYSDILALEESYTVEDAVLIYRCEVEAIENIAAVSEFNMD